MRKKLALAMAGVSILTLGVGVAYADLTSGPAPQKPVTTASDPNLVTLPTGDRVQLGPGRVATFLPAEGREDVRYFSPQLPGSTDRIVIPDDAFDEVESGRLDSRLFNVDALRRAGFDDARKVEDVSVLEGPRLSAPAADPASTRVTIKLVARDGGVPTRGVISYSDLTDPNNSGGLLVSEGEASFFMKPGAYGFVFGIRSNLADGSIEVTGAVSDITVGVRPVSQTVDARHGNPVSLTVDRSDAVQQNLEANFTTFLYDGQKAAGQNFRLIPGDRLYGIPSPVEGHQAGMILKSQFLAPEDTPADQRYSYNLVKPVVDGIPGDLSFHIADQALAEVRVNYQGFAVPARGRRSSYPVYRQLHGGVDGGTDFVDVPGARTEYFTADPDVSWTHGLTVFHDAASMNVYRDAGSYQPGTHTLDLYRTASSMAVENAHLTVDEVHGSRFRFLAAPFSGGPADQLTSVRPLVGSQSVSFNGTLLYKGDVGDVYLENEQIPTEDGRYTVRMVGSAADDLVWLHPGSKFEGEFGFDVSYVEGHTDFTVGAVRFDSDDIVDSYAQAGSTVDVDLTYASQGAAYDTDVATPLCTAMTFEVSYDDGATWQPVEIDRDGNRATASLTHPSDAEYVSLRFTAEDEAGNTVKHTTIRSYGLR